jgi:hypothetical protein
MKSVISENDHDSSNLNNILYVITSVKPHIIKHVIRFMYFVTFIVRSHGMAPQFQMVQLMNWH